MWRRASATVPSRTRRCSEPSPSTRVRFWTWNRRSPVRTGAGGVATAVEPPKPPSISCMAGLLIAAPPPRRGVLGELRRIGVCRTQLDAWAPAEPVGHGAERLGGTGEAGEQATDIGRGEAAQGRPVDEPVRQPIDIRALARAEAAVAAPAD